MPGLGFENNIPGTDNDFGRPSGTESLHRYQALRASMCLARLEWSGAGEGVAEAGGALRTGSGQGSKDLPGSGSFWSLIAAGDFACNHRGAKLAFGQIVSGLDTVVIQKGKEMIALFIEPKTHGLFGGFTAGRLQ